MPLDFNNGLPAGATPLSQDELEQLIPAGVTTRNQLDQFEARNIQEGLIWAMRSKRKLNKLLSTAYICKLHHKLFDQTWAWAGQYRRREVNIGNTSPEQIAVRLHDLCEDAKYWLEFETFPLDEACVRFHHRLVQIHPFPNGNGRHSRIMADLLRTSKGEPVFSWHGATGMAHNSQRRELYIAALQSADRGNIEPILSFARG